MRIPTIHLNGTGKKMLIEGYFNAHTAIRNAKKALEEIEFNPRDYYVQGSDAWEEARKEMNMRLEMLSKVAEEIDQILEALDI